MVGLGIFQAVSAIGQAFGAFKTGQAQEDAAKQAMQDRERAKAAQEESQRIASANEKAKLIAAQRQAAREESVRRARILNAAEISGVGGSSGAIGSVGTLGTNFGTAVSTSAGREVAIGGINNFNQQAANAFTDANNAISRGNVEAAGWGVFSSVSGAAGSIASSTLGVKAASKLDNKFKVDQRAESIFDSIFS